MRALCLGNKQKKKKPKKLEEKAETENENDTFGKMKLAELGRGGKARLQWAYHPFGQPDSSACSIVAVVMPKGEEP